MGEGRPQGDLGGGRPRHPSHDLPQGTDQQPDGTNRREMGPIIFAGLLCLVTGYMTVASLSFSFQPRIAPLLFSGITFLCAITILVIEAGNRRREPTPHTVKSNGRDPTEGNGDPIAAKGLRSSRESLAFAWLTALVAAFFFLGFLLGMSLFMIAFTRIQGRESWIASLGITAALMFVLYGLFAVLLEVRIYSGMIVELLPFMA